MGLHIHSLAELPATTDRSYIIYFLDYGWSEPLAQALRANFERAADMASRTNSAVIRGTSYHFADEVLAWHQVNGQPGADLLPALLIVREPPAAFRDARFDLVPPGPPGRGAHGWRADDRLVLVPLREVCTTETEVVQVVGRLFEDIKEGRALRDFTVARELRAGEAGVLQDALVLQPNFSGIGVDLPKLWGWITATVNRWRS